MKLFFRIFIWFQALLMISLVSALKAETTPGTYVALDVKGAVTWVNPMTKDERPLKTGSKLPTGALINTGDNSSVVLAFASGATTTLTSNTSIEVSAFTQEPFAAEALLDDSIEPSVSVTEINIIRGELVGQVRKLRTGSEFNVQSPVGAAGVRGTTYSVSYDPSSGKLSVKTASGLVVVLTSNGQSFTVSSSTKVDVTSDNAVPEVVQISSEESVLINEIAEAATASSLGQIGSNANSTTVKQQLKKIIEIVNENTTSSDEVSVSQ